MDIDVWNVNLRMWLINDIPTDTISNLTSPVFDTSGDLVKLFNVAFIAESVNGRRSNGEIHFGSTHGNINGYLWNRSFIQFVGMMTVRSKELR